MPAGLPGSTAVQNAANPSLGAPVTFDLLSGPKGSPFDNDKDYANATAPFPTSTGAVANANASTGALATGIGFGPAIGTQGIGTITPNFNDDYTPGVTKPDNTPSANSTHMYIGGGRMIKDASYPSADHMALFIPNPYTAGFGIGAAGQAGTRDAGAGPAFTGFPIKMVTAAADVAAAGVIETGFVNRSGVTLKQNASQFGVASAGSATPAMVEPEETPTVVATSKEVEKDPLPPPTPPIAGPKVASVKPGTLHPKK